MEITERLGPVDLAYALFVAPLDELDHPTGERVRAAIETVLSGCGGDCAVCVGYVAQEAGDHPEEYQRRMRWALATVQQTYRQVMVLAS